jgi:hypothetical protein
LEGVCKAEMDDAADAPEEADAMDCGRAVERPAMGSALEAGHMLRAVRRFEFQSPCTAPLAPLLWPDAADMVEFEEAVDERELSEEDEFVRWACLRGRSMRDTSSADIVLMLKPLLLLGPLHPVRLLSDWKFGGGATAVICGGGQERWAMLSVM